MGLLEGKNAIITGSARGIGRATAELFAANGANVLINDLDADAAEQASSEIDGPTAVFACDLTETDAADRLVEAAVEAFDSVDIVVNNAGYTWDGMAHKMTDEQFQAMLDIHTIVPFRVSRALASHWRDAARTEAGEGQEVFRKLINVSSVSGTMGNTGQANYSAAKAGLHGFTMAVAQETAAKGITVNTVSPGYVETAMTSAMPEDVLKAIIGGIPMGRMGKPEEIADTVNWLAQESTAYITGANIPVNGGLFISA